MHIQPISSDSPAVLIDSHGRCIDYVRLSLTDRCNLRCTYCMPEDMRFVPRPELLSAAEIELLAKPLVRRDCAEIVERLGRLIGHGLDALRSADATDMDEAIDRAMAGKPLAHDFVSAQQMRRPAVARSMNQTGG